MVRDTECTVFECWVDQDWFIDFRRSLSSIEFQRWTLLYDELQHIALEEHSIDLVFWALDQTKLFTTKSLYRFLSSRGMPSRVAGIIWKCKIPLKIKFFLWQMFNNKLPLGQSLIKRGWKGDGNCCVCGVGESVDHIFFHCVLAKMSWAIFKRFFIWRLFPDHLRSCLKFGFRVRGPCLFGR
jgi:hypothetical protein